MNSIRRLLNSVIDYAGLFPPASLGMAETVRNYAAYCNGEHSWILGRLIVPAVRLNEFEACAAELHSRHHEDRTWRLSVLGGTDHKADLEYVTAFNRRHGQSTDPPPVVIDAIEWKVRSAEEIQDRVTVLSGPAETYFEIPLSDDTRELLAVIGRAGGRAKVRTGGSTPEMFLSPPQLARFISLCVEARVPFKATAGLHHPLRSIHPLTYEPSSPTGIMHGFLNVLLAAAFTHTGADVKVTEEILREESMAAFEFSDNGVRWRGRPLTDEQLVNMREHLFIAFGACSFLEATSGMRALDLL